METIQDNKGPEGAKNPSMQNSNIQTPANGSYERSQVIAAISKSLGYDGLHSPVSDIQNGVEYTFDFYHQESEQLFKLFRGFDEHAYRLYSSHPGKPILIFEAKDLPCKMETCECGCGSVLIVDKSVAVRLYDDPQVLIHDEGNLWDYNAHVDGRWMWKKRTPFIIRELMADGEDGEEFDGEEEDED